MAFRISRSSLLTFVTGKIVWDSTMIGLLVHNNGHYNLQICYRQVEIYLNFIFYVIWVPYLPVISTIDRIVEYLSGP